LVDDESRPVSGLRRRAVLAALALHGGEVVGTGRLVDVVWGESAPSTVLNTLQSHVSYLRTILGSKGAIQARPPGYVLDLGPDGTDVQVAERLLRDGTQASDPVQGAAHLETALSLWRGRPLADLTGLAWLEEQAERLDMLGVQVKRALFEARLDSGEHRQLVPGLEQLVAEHPLDEQIHGQLMLALYRSGRQADALAAYQRLRRTLDEQLGIDPSQPLRDLEMAILRQDRTLEAPAQPVVVPLAAPAAPVPAQLPPAVPAFAGRGAELARLDAAIPGAGGDDYADPAAVAITAVSGTAGVGKTTLALHWAHRAAAQFPDGQLYVNLRGYDAGGPALDAGEAVRGFLDALGVHPAGIPEGMAAQAGLYRSLLAGKRVLVVLDNARDAEQVRPLLPGSPGCAVIVTSRNHLTGLVAAEGARPLSLDLMPAGDARDLLARRLGAERTEAEPDAVEEIVDRCVRLPLALTIAAARAAINPAFPLSALASELSEAGRALDVFDGGDLATDVRAVFSWSYHALSDDAALLFRLLGLHRGRDIAINAAASLAGVPADRARALLAELTRAHLLAEPSPGRYAFHDLLRAYAAEQARSQDSAAARDAAVRRILDHYLHTARRAAVLLDPYPEPVALPPVQAGVIIGEPACSEDAMAWFGDEHAALLAALRLSAQVGMPSCTWQLATMLTPYHLRIGLWEDQATACNAGLDAAVCAGDAEGQAHALLGLAMGRSRSGRFADSAPLFEDVLRYFELTGDHQRQMIIHSCIAWICERDHRYTEMLAHARRGLDLCCAAGDRRGQVIAINDIGYCYAVAGNYEQALSYCQRALAASREIGERAWESAAWDSLGLVQHKLGNHRQAIMCYERAADLARALSDAFNETVSLVAMGDVYETMGDIPGARRVWRRALRILDAISHPDAAEVRAKLRRGSDPVRHDLSDIPHLPDLAELVDRPLAAAQTGA
jgi:DNA-binding SARP family transcriptional activator/Tfp pilus assembly protein PilF